MIPSNRLEKDCAFCDLVRDLYPSYQADDEALQLILKHLEVAHNYHPIGPRVSQ